jgi:hypothetical protein
MQHLYGPNFDADDRLLGRLAETDAWLKIDIGINFDFHGGINGDCGDIKCQL